MTSNFSDLKLWLEICLKKEQLTDIKVNNVKSSEKGSGFIGDVAFIRASGKTEHGLEKKYNLVLKCSKNSKILRETSPAKSLFLNEIYFFETLLPAFTKFQIDQGIENPFNAVPKYYGSFTSNDREVLVLEDLAPRGYGLWDKKIPLTRNHISLVVREYAKFHAISVAMQDQLLQEYQALTKPVDKLFDEFERSGNSIVLNFTRAIEEVYHILKGDLDENVLLRWWNFGKYIETNFLSMIKNYNGLKVVNHGDCWNNNFMFQTKNNIKLPLNVAILDWQIAKMTSPVSDLSHFLFGCISLDDLNDLGTILDDYYNTFSDYLVKLKSNPQIYSKEQFLADWQQYSKFGIVFASITTKVCVSDTEDIMDISEAAEQGDYAKTFQFEITNKTRMRDRIIHIVKYVVEHNLI